jgi:tagaturonate epimerase
MSNGLLLSKYSVGVGDRFAHQAKAQLQACMKAAEEGVDVIPVWNKSNREHTIIGSNPVSTRAAADEAVRSLGWKKPYHVDADHINLESVNKFIDSSDFFTIDVADWIGTPPDPERVQKFLNAHPELIGTLQIPGIERRFRIGRDFVLEVANKYLLAAQQAGRVYRHIERKKGAGQFIPEVSMDETDAPQKPVELLIILAALSDEKVPIQTIAPKFTGRFNKGVDYVGDLEKFTEEFSNDVAVVAFAIEQYGMPGNLKLSIHSGSDKFSLYSPIHQILQSSGAGVHLKTAGTNWLEELIGLAEGGGEGLELAKEIYAQAYALREELCKPYAAVIDIDPGELPTPEAVSRWSSDEFVSALRHNPQCPAYNSSLRQLLHVGFKVAAKMGTRYLNLLSAMETSVAKNVTENLFDRHIRPLFIGNTQH